MPQSIPFDPSLTLGNIVHPDKITALQAVGEAQQPINLAQEKLNSFILAKRSLDMTVQQMVQMQVTGQPMTDLITQVDGLKNSMAGAAGEYAAATATALPLVQAAQQASSKVISVDVESPIDWNKSSLKQMDLSSDTMIMDAQYFRYESNKDDTTAHANSVASYVSGQVSSIFGPTYGASAAGTTRSTTMSQTTNHEIQGTLVITANCTHKTANMFAPFVLDPEKGIRAWNANNPSDQIETTSAGIAKALKEDDAKKALYLLSGQTQGSSFVGLVHFLKSEKADSSQSSGSSTAELNASFEENCWLASSQGKFGVDSQFSNSVKRMLSTSNIQSHASVITMGLIPSLASNKMSSTVATLAPKPEEVMDKLAKIQASSDSVVTSTSSAATKAKVGESFMALDNGYITNAVSAIGKIDNDDNKVIDTNSLMTAFDAYVKLAREGKCGGIPINFYLKPLTPKELASAYLAKFAPKTYWQYSSGDDEAKAQKTDG
jgi:hypothetical protein